MFKNMSEIAADFSVSAKAVGQVLYTLGVRDPEHPVQKGFPYEQYITHGIAKPMHNSRGELRYFLYNIAPMKEEFEKVLKASQESRQTDTAKVGNRIILEKLSQIITKLHSCADTGQLSLIDTAIHEIGLLQNSLRASDPDLSMPLDERAKRLFDTLRAWRNEEAKTQGKPAYTLLGNAVLHAIAFYRPRSTEELLAIKGIGEKKVHQYGEALLTMIGTPT